MNKKYSKSQIFIFLIIILIIFHFVLLYIYINHKNNEKQASDRDVTLTKVEDEVYSDNLVPNQMTETGENGAESPTNVPAFDENGNPIPNGNIIDGAMPALMSKNNNEIEGNPNYQTLFPNNNQPVDNRQNIASDFTTNQSLSVFNDNQAFPVVNGNDFISDSQIDTSENLQKDMTTEVKKTVSNSDKKSKREKAVKSRRTKKQSSIINEPYIDEPMYLPVYREPKPQVTEQDIKDSALLSTDLPETRRSQLPINSFANQKLQQMEQAKEKNNELQEQLSGSIQTVRNLNAQRIEQEKQLARRAYEDNLAMQKLKNEVQYKTEQQAPQQVVEPTKQDKKEQP